MRMKPLHVIWALLAIELPFVFVASNPVIGDDIWWLLKYGELMLERRELVGQDPFTFTPLAPQAVNAPWLAEIMVYAVYALGGAALLVFFFALATGAAFGLVFATTWERTRSVRLAALVNVAAFGLVASNLSARAQTLAFALFALSAYALAAAPRSGRWLFAVPVAELVWVNIHGSYPLGLVLASCFMAGAAWEQLSAPTEVGSRLTRRYALTLSATALALLVNPHGLAALSYVQQIGANPIIRALISEWRPPTPNDSLGLGLFCSLGLVAAVLYRSPRTIGARDVLLLGVFGLLALQAVRNVAWWALIAAPIAAQHLAALPEWRTLGERLRALDARTTATNSRAPAWIAGCLLGLVLFVSLPWIKVANPLLPADKRSLLDASLPFGAVDFVKALPDGRVYNYQLWGGYLLWELWPRHRVYGDGRIEIHPPKVWDDYLKLRHGHAEWQRLLDDYHVDYLFLHREQQHELVALAELDAEWRVLYRDGAAVVFGRRAR